MERGCSLFRSVTSSKVEFISTFIGSAAFFYGAFFREEPIMEADYYSWIDDLFSRGAHGYVFFVIDRRTFSGCGVHTACTKRLFLRRGSACFFHPVRLFERYLSSRIYGIFSPARIYRVVFFCIMRIERLFFIRCYRHVDFSSVLSFCALRFFKLLLMIDLSLVLSEVLSMWIFL